MNTRLIIPLLIAGALAFACGPRSHSEAPAALASAMPMRNALAERPTRRRETTPKNEAKVDSHLEVAIAQEGVRLALNVKNIGKKHVELKFPSGKSYDFAVVDSTGREVWRWSKGRMFTQGVQNKQLSAGESMDATETWKALGAPGRYTAVATLNSTNFPSEQRVEFFLP